ncbi:hypothetical protein APA_3305 [Pseudanabaena sp. lw0831]|jgi:hypothetical protein|uniref:hypothetical protein n=1 Tax=Pseudanabaena sp. lw0831 TaxID=1357935 RepID=UPI001915C35C|nr:hypothetical protein [Pseudanabaena sp. lw0831]GBO55255.1 hypothetical protein APA_3305 [Pseudanabaena sp. lw0831]
MKKITNHQKLISLLHDGCWHSNDELAAKVSFKSYKQTVDEARKKYHYPIEIRQVDHHKFEYRLLQTA